MQAKGQKFIALFLVFSLMTLSANLYAKGRRGAILIITKKNGHQTEGELITVKPNSLLLLSITGRDMSVGIADIKVIRIVKKSKVGKGLLYGLLIGGGGGVLLGFIFPTYIDEYNWGPFFYGILGGGGGLLLGGLIGATEGRDKTIQIEGISDLEIKEVLEKLHKKARIPDYK